jgi:diguanylate cyclase (GGDEF)-like protein
MDGFARDRLFPAGDHSSTSGAVFGARARPVAAGRAQSCRDSISTMKTRSTPTVRHQDPRGPTPQPGPQPAAHGAIESGGDAAARYRDLAAASDQPVIVCVDGIIRLANEAVATVAGSTSGPDGLVARPIADFVDMSSIPASVPMTAPMQYVDIDVTRPGGSRTPMRVAWMHCRFEGRDAIQIVMRDPAPRREAVREVPILLRHDPLTDMPNRVEFRDRLAGAFARAERNKRLVAVVALNIDRFRNINAAHGSDAGDEVLQAIAARLVGTIRKADSAARIDGDEFALILEGIEQRSQAAVAVNRVLTAIRQPIALHSTHVSVTASAGIAACPADSDDVDALLRLVDIALFAMKGAGGNGFRFYGAEMESQSVRDLARREQTLKRIESLAAREREVMDLLVEGHSNKAIGSQLGVSPNVIDVQRSKVMLKMRAESVPDLVRMVTEARSVR